MKKQPRKSSKNLLLLKSKKGTIASACRVKKCSVLLKKFINLKLLKI